MSGMPSNYLTPIIDFLSRQLPDCDRSLLRYYALLAFTRGVNTTLENVHDARALWRAETDPAHRSLVPFSELTPEVQQLDAPYMTAIHLAAMKVTA